VLDIGVVKAERDEHAGDVVGASVQTLLQRLAQTFGLVVVDECHHALPENSHIPSNLVVAGFRQLEQGGIHCKYRRWRSRSVALPRALSHFSLAICPALVSSRLCSYCALTGCACDVACPRVHVVRSVAMGSRSLHRLRGMVTWRCLVVVTCITTPREHALETGDWLVPIPEDRGQQLRRLAFGQPRAGCDAQLA